MKVIMILVNGMRPDSLTFYSGGELTDSAISYLETR